MAERKPRKKNGWQPISSLPDRPTTRMALWSPGDELCLASMFYTPADMERLREGDVYTHWQELEGPK